MSFVNSHYTMSKLIVIEGTDGAGKATHLNLAVEKLKAAGHKIEVVDFPQYGTKSAGPAEEYLNGKYGGVNEVSPYAASLLYAVDRFDASFRMRKALADGKMVISNRYVLSSAAHQGTKIKDPAERKKFLEWLDGIEYGIMNLPRPDIIIFLHVPAKIGYELVLKKSERAHLNGKKQDIHEIDLAYLKSVESTYKELASQDPTIKTVECAPSGTLLSIEEIHPLVMNIINATL